MLDEMPYGEFVEIEGENLEQIQSVAAKLHLVWDATIDRSYTALFERVRQKLTLSSNDLSFKNFNGIQVTADLLGVQPADR